MDRYEKHFNERLKALKDFYKKEKRWPSETAIDDQERTLGVWCRKIRLANNKGTLEKYKLQALNHIGFPLQPREDQWKKNFEKLKRYVKEHKNCPHFSHELFPFTHSQYTRFNDLSEEKRELLNSIDFLSIWENRRTRNSSYNATWKENFKNVKEFFHTHGKLPTRKTHLKLEYWVSLQRKLRKKGRLEQEKIKLFEEAGIDLLKKTFSVNKIDWDTRFNELNKFVQKNRRLPGYREPKEKPLYAWLINSKNQLAKNKLPKDKEEKLRPIIERFFSAPGKRKHEPFEKVYQRVKDFYQKHKRWPGRGSSSMHERKLAKWCFDCRNRFKRNELSPSKVQALKKIDFLFDFKAYEREKKFEMLKTFLKDPRFKLSYDNTLYKFYLRQKANYKLLDEEKKKLIDRVKIAPKKKDVLSKENWDHCFNQVVSFIKKNKRPPAHEKEKRLYYWWLTIKRRLEQDGLSAEELDILKQVEKIVPLNRRLQWDRYFEQVKRFVVTNKRWPGITNNYENELNGWCRRQRDKFGKKELSLEQFEKLQSIGFPFKTTRGRRIQVAIDPM